MNLEQLRYFKIVAEEENIAKAAAKLCISSPALHSTIARLEKYVGYSMFDKKGRYIYLNAHGKVMYKYVCEFLDLYDRLQVDMVACTNKQSNEDNVIRIGVSALTLWQEPIMAYLDAHQEAKIDHVSLKTKQMVDEGVLSGFDFIITDVHDIKSDLWKYCILIPEDNPVIIVNGSNPLAYKDRVEAEDLIDKPFIALSQGYSSRHYFDQVMEFLNIKPHIYTESDYPLRSALIKAGKGIGISTVYGSMATLLEGLVAVPINPAIPRVQALFWRKDKKLLEQQLDFKEYLINFFKKYKPWDLQGEKARHESIKKM